MTPNPTLGYRERASVTTIPLSEGWRVSMSNCLDVGAKEKLPLLGEEGTEQLKEAVTALI